VYVLEAMREGQRYTIKLDARDEEEAERELATFDRDPKGYRRPTPAPAAGALRLDLNTIATVAAWQASEGQSKDHRYATKLYLTAWANALRGAPLEALTADRCEALLASWKTARKLRIVALKTFCTFYVKRGQLAPEKNPAARLEVPSKPAAVNFAPRHYTRDEVERAYAASGSQVERDVMRLCLVGGLHVTEVERFAAGVGRLVAVEGQGEIVGVLWVLHKSGEQHPVSLDAAAFAAAERIRARGRIPDRAKRHDFAVRVARRLGENARPIQFGALRHSFITWARSAGGRVVRPKNFGVGLEEIREAVGHRSTSTTRRYDGTEIPPMIVVPVTLTHGGDPKPQSTTGSLRRSPRSARLLRAAP
jgi:integrase